MTSNELRRLFLSYFAEHGHTILPSSLLIPATDPSLLFTNAGMVPFKDTFLGLEQLSYNRATTAQRCLRVGGKHNDLDNVGYTARHHTFFEMLGNFSFGDYFKREAIEYAWTFLTQVLGLPPEKLWITVFTEDDEAAEIWLKEQRIDPQRFSRCGISDNFWSMGNTGPCGPCSEIFYDHGPTVPGGPPGSPEAEGDRYVELWNLVFIQYQRTLEGRLLPLPHPSVDTGMGLERLAAVMQAVLSNYDTDLFRPLIQAAAQLAGLTDEQSPSLRVIADHIRATTFLLTDGVLPSNEGRGYVLRRVIRRAVRHGYQLGLQLPFFYQLLAILVTHMGKAYPELQREPQSLAEIIRQEELQFAQTLSQGMKLFSQAIAGLTDQTIPGQVAFRLYDTYGFPLDLTADMAREKGLQLDTAGFEVEMAKQRRQSRATNRFNVNYNGPALQPTDFVGYEHLTYPARVMTLWQHNQPVDHLLEGMEGAIVLDHTPFYAEGGGQVGDQGWLTAEGIEFIVHDTHRIGPVYWHSGYLAKGLIATNAMLEAQVDSTKRQATALNHSATHLLHAALRQVLGTGVIQKGSLVMPERLRFDFTYPTALSPEYLAQIERLVNQQIRTNLSVDTEVMSPLTAKQAGALAFFGEKYGEQVRVLSMGNFSKELCGGTHVQRTGDIGLFKIINETSIAAGVRRIEAITGEHALAWITSLEHQLQTLADLLTTHRDAVSHKAHKLLEHNQQLEQQLSRLQQALINIKCDMLCPQATVIGDITLVTAVVQGLEPPLLRLLVDQLKSKLKNAVIALAVVLNNKAHCVLGVDKNYNDKLPADELAQAISALIQGKGGGRADFAQVGGGHPHRLEEAFTYITHWVKDKTIS